MTPAPRQLAQTYDATFTDRVSRAEDRLVQRHLARHINDSDVLDVGCGTGSLLAQYAPRSYVGIDPSPAMITQAAINWVGVTHPPRYHTDAMTKRPGGGVTFARMAGELAQPRRAFDTITCLWAYPYLDDPELCLRNWAHALRPGGSILLVTWDDRYHPTWPVEHHPVTIERLTIDATLVGLTVLPLAGLCDRETARRLARALPIPLAARLIQRPAQTAPAYILRLLKAEPVEPRAAWVSPLRIERRRGFQPITSRAAPTQPPLKPPTPRRAAQ